MTKKSQMALEFGLKVEMGNIFICLKMGSIFIAPPNDDVDPTIHGQ